MFWDNFDFQYLLDIMSTAYNYLMSFAVFFAEEPARFMAQLNTGNGYIFWSFINPFDGGATVMRYIDTSVALELFLAFFINSGFGTVPLWVGVLSLGVLIWFIVLILRILPIPKL